MQQVKAGSNDALLLFLIIIIIAIINISLYIIIATDYIMILYWHDIDIKILS